MRVQPQQLLSPAELNITVSLRALEPLAVRKSASPTRWDKPFLKVLVLQALVGKRIQIPFEMWIRVLGVGRQPHLQHVVLLWGSAQCFWYSSSWSCLIQEKMYTLKRAFCCRVHFRTPWSERAKKIMNKILMFPFMWNRAEFQDLSSKSHNLQENTQ